MTYVSADQKNDDILEGVRKGVYKLVYFTPEMLLLNKHWRVILLTSKVYTQNLRALIVDEAHTVKNGEFTE